MTVIYRLLIVDDEEIIVNGLYEIFSSIHTFELDVYKAYSGEEAIEWLNRTRFDIVLTDIRMPETDGIRLLDEIIKNWPQCRVIFLTGHNEFEYVYKAIQHKNVSYLLKTEDPERVVNEVEKTIKDIEKGIKIENLIQKAKEQMDMIQDLYQKDYLTHLLHKDTSLEISKAQFEQLSIPLYSDKPIILLLGYVDTIPADLSYWEKVQFFNSIRFLLNQNLNARTRNITIMDDAYRCILFIQPNELSMDNQSNERDVYQRAFSFLKGTLEVIQAICRESLNTSISFALGEPCSWERVAQKYYSLSQLLSFLIGCGMEKLIIDNDPNRIGETTRSVEMDPNDENDIYMLMHPKKMNAFEMYLESGQKEKYFGALSELIKPLKGNSKDNIMAVLAYYKVAMCMLSYIHRSKLSEKLSFYIGNNQLMQTNAYQSWEEAIDYLYRLSDEIFKHQCEEEKSRTDSTIMYIQEFITDHLSENLSLVRLAEQVYLNPSYLSRLYKQITGMNLSTYIDHIRIEKAKELLNSNDIKIYEAAKSVGYDNPGSFTRFFRNMTGLSPQEYLDSVRSLGN